MLLLFIIGMLVAVFIGLGAVLVSAAGYVIRSAGELSIIGCRSGCGESVFR